MEARSGNEGIPYSDREDFSIDKDIRASIFDKWLLENGFKYISTLMSNTGGVRQYENKDIYVGIFKNKGDAELYWYIDRTSDHRELGNGTGLSLMMFKIKKFSK